MATLAVSRADKLALEHEHKIRAAGLCKHLSIGQIQKLEVAGGLLGVLALAQQAVTIPPNQDAAQKLRKLLHSL